MAWWPCYQNSFLNSYQGDFDAFLQYFAENKLDARLVLYQACTDGYLDIVQWLVKEHKVNIHDNNDVAFRWACGNGHIQIAKWLVANHAVDVHSHNEAAFRYACTSRQMQVIAWFEQELNSSMRYFFHNRHPYIINHAPIPDWQHRDVLGCSILYQDDFDEKAIIDKLATIRSVKSARSAKI